MRCCLASIVVAVMAPGTWIMAEGTASTGTPLAQSPPPTEKTPAPNAHGGGRNGMVGGNAPLRRRLGCSHVSGTYSFTSEDYLNEGAQQILDAGMRVIKAYLHAPERSYRFNSEWPRFRSLVEMAEHPYYRALFSKPFETFILTAYSMHNRNEHYWRSGISDKQCADEEREFHDLAAYLLRTFRGSGKTFVLQHWEGDWAIRGSSNAGPSADPSPTAIDGMIRWLNARQNGVDRARREAKDTDVKVYHACEVNLVAIAMNGRRTVTNDVIPKTHCDLYSYSAYDTIGAAADDPAKGRALFHKALDHLAAKAPRSAAFGDRNVYVGEFGWPEVQSHKDPAASTEKSLRVIRMTVEEASAWGCPYIVYWQVYDNESRSGKRRPSNDEVRGFYLIRPDGTHAPAFDYFRSLIETPRPASRRADTRH